VRRKYRVPVRVCDEKNTAAGASTAPMTTQRDEELAPVAEQLRQEEHAESRSGNAGTNRRRRRVGVDAERVQRERRRQRSPAPG
jgi:hypothetical protein